MKGKIVLSLFALPFFGFGAWMLWSVGIMMSDAVAMRSWTAVPARIVSAGYDTRSGDDSNTYEARAEYRYSMHGRSHIGHRVSIGRGADNIGDYQRNLGNRLGRAMSSGRTVTVYVNPSAPEQAIVDRSLRWGVIGFKAVFILVFGGIGVGLPILAWRRPAAEDDNAPEPGLSPWLANDAWQSASIRSGSKTAMWGAWFFAGIWNAISAVLPFVAYREVVEKENYLALVALLFPLVGVGLMVWAVRRTLEWRRFGMAAVELDPFPGSIGGHVGGTIDLELPFDPSLRFHLTLTGIHTYISGTGKNRSRREDARWQDECVAHAEPGGRGTRLSFRFDVPEELAESDATRRADSYNLWRLNLSAELPGTDLDRDYDIPVYATATRSRRLAERALAQAREQQSALHARTIRGRFRFDPYAADKRMFYPVGRHFGSAFGGLMIGSIFAGAGGFFIVNESSWLFGIVFGGVGALIALACLYMMMNSLEVYQDGTGIVSVRRLLGIPVRTRRMSRHDFTRFLKHSSMRSRSGNKHVIYYSVLAVDRSGNQVVVGEGFRGENEANAAVDFIANAFGLNVTEGKATKTTAADTIGDDVLTADS